MESEEMNFFDYLDDWSQCGISRIVRRNDAASLRAMLKERSTKRELSPLSADNKGWTAMHIAASKKERKKCLQLLLRYSETLSIDLNGQSYEGETALFIACERGLDENVALLLVKGSDANVKKPDGTSPLHVAASKGYRSIVERLLEYGARIDDPDWQGFTALHLAALYGHPDVCGELIEKGAQIHALDSHGNLALHLACQSGNFVIVRLLLEKSEDDCNGTSTVIDHVNYDEITPLMLAVRNAGNENEICVRYLLEMGANAELKSRDGYTALQLAAVGGNERILKILLENTDVTRLKRNNVQDLTRVLNTEGVFYSLICCALSSRSLQCLSVLLESELERNVIGAPYVENSGCHVDVFSPLAYLFSVYAGETIDEAFDQVLRLLLQHGDVVYVNDLLNETEIEWPKWRVSFVNPYAIIFSSEWPQEKRLTHFNVLHEHNVTPDYCLKCYNNNANAFEDFTAPVGYLAYYKPVLDAVCHGHLDTIGLFLSHSCILEPDRLRDYLMMKVASYTLCHELDANLNRLRASYLFLNQLKPAYRERRISNWQEVRFFDSLPVEEEFAGTNLQQLCRTVVRQRLRDLSLSDNLRNFNRRIRDLPLPAYLKDYLVFKN